MNFLKYWFGFLTFGATLKVNFGGDEMQTTSTSAQTTNNTTTTNIDRRQAVQDGVAVNGDGNRTEYNSTDAVKAIAAMGADTIKNMGDSVTNLYKDAGKNTTDSFNSTVKQSVSLIDKLTDSVSDGFGLAKSTIDKFQPNENKSEQTKQYAAIAAAVVAGVLLFKGKN